MTVGSGSGCCGKGFCFFWGGEGQRYEDDDGERKEGRKEGKKIKIYKKGLSASEVYTILLQLIYDKKKTASCFFSF